MDESERKHLDAAEQRWEREEGRTRTWSVVLRLLPFCVVAGLLAIAFRVFR